MRQESMVYMIALSKRRNISAAAAECGISQSSFSGHLQRLEKNLGCALFERRAGELTPEGELYVAAAKEILRLQSEMEAELKALVRPALRLGISETIERGLFSQVAAALFEAAPKLDIHIDWGRMAPMIQQLRQRELDVLFGINPGLAQSDVLYREIMTEQLFLILPRAHPPLGADPLCVLRELNSVILFRGTQLHQEIERLLARRGIAPSATLESNSYEVAHFLVRDSRCVAIVPASALPLFSDCVTIPLPGVQLSTGFCCLRQLWADAELRRVIGLLVRAVRQVCGGWAHVQLCGWEETP